MKKLLSLITLLISIFTLASCNTSIDYDIVTTLFPVYDATSNITKDELSVKLIIPLGTETHHFEPTPKDIMIIKKSKLFIYTSDAMEPWAKKLINSNNINAINLSTLLGLDDYDDYHYWTDPVIFTQMITVITDHIEILDRNNLDFYNNNSKEYINLINAVTNDLSDFLKINNLPIFFYGHNALEAFENRFSLTITSLSKNYQPDGEITPKQILELKNNIKMNNAKYLFTEELIDLRLVNNLVKELKYEGYSLEVLELHGYHNITKKQYQKGVTYYELFKQNSSNIKKAFTN